jgi:hypothetical protein
MHFNDYLGGYPHYSQSYQYWALKFEFLMIMNITGMNTFINKYLHATFQCPEDKFMAMNLLGQRRLATLFLRLLTHITRLPSRKFV